MLLFEKCTLLCVCIFNHLNYSIDVYSFFQYTDKKTGCLTFHFLKIYRSPCPTHSTLNRQSELQIDLPRTETTKTESTRRDYNYTILLHFVNRKMKKIKNIFSGSPTRPRLSEANGGSLFEGTAVLVELAPLHSFI